MEGVGHDPSIILVAAAGGAMVRSIQAGIHVVFI
jgi:hypothetical protein